MISYDKMAVGDRIRLKRNILGLTQEELAERIDRVPKYCADIERGQCGMSIDTMLAFSNVLNMSLDYMFYGKGEDEPKSPQCDEVDALLEMLKNCPERKRKYALEILKIYFKSFDSEDERKKFSSKDEKKG